MRASRKRNVWIITIVVVAVVIAELLLRSFWGFGNMVLFYEDPAFEYLALPNQSVKRFGNRIFYNANSMRSEPLTSDDGCVVLGLGDSVINGGTLVDQDSLTTTLVENEFSGKLRFLNISAGSWGPDNCAAYVEKFGTFNAKMIVLFVSSHDAHDNMAFDKTVGVNESYPDHQYPLAIIEVLDKYIIPRVSGMLSSKAPAAENLMINKNGEGFNKGFQKLLELSQNKQIPFVVCLHAERMELLNKSFNSQGDEILAFCRSNQIKVITGFEVGERPEYYRDDIHLNEKGQKAWVSAIADEISSKLSPCLK
jgi:hypothetical protein